MEKVKVAVIGAGTMGTNHCRSIKRIDDYELVAVCESDPKKVAAAEKEFGCDIYGGYEELLNNCDCDAVIIATPHYSHTDIGIAALQAGKHVLVEKPISVHKADCERLIAAHTDKTKVFAAMFNQRTHPAYRKVKQLMDAGEIGRLMRVNWVITDWFRPQSYYNSGGWRATWKGEGGGVLINQCPHQLDLLQWLCGRPSRITAICAIGKYHDIEVEDEVTALLEYPDGATGVFVTPTGEAPGTNRLEIAGTRGKVVVENGNISFIRNEIPCDEFARVSNKAFDAPEVWNIEIPVAGDGGQHDAVFANFARAILSGEPLLAPAEEGIHSVELANAMLLSSLTGAPVDLPLDGALFEEQLQQLIRQSRSENKKVQTVDLSGFNESF